MFPWIRDSDFYPLHTTHKYPTPFLAPGIWRSGREIKLQMQLYNCIKISPFFLRNAIIELIIMLLLFLCVFVESFFPNF